MAAYEGNVDRYARLMRPGYMEETEGFCVVRGIFHHTMFARWWAEQLEVNPDRIRTPESYEVFNHISEAINARRVMINEISGFNDDTEYLPYMIWWPLKPMEHSLRVLAKQCPKMKHQIAIACIFCDYEDLYREIQFRPQYHIWLAAKQSPNSFYLSDLEVRAAELGFEVSHPTYYWTGATTDWLARDLEPTTDLIFSPLNPYIMSDDGQRCGTYFEYNIQPGVIERYVWQGPDLMHKLASHGNHWQGTLDCTEDLDLMEDLD